MKKRYVIILLTALVLSLTACGGEEKENTETTEENGEASEGGEETAEEVQLPQYDPVLREDLTSTIVSLGEYKGLEAVRTQTEVTDEDVQNEIDTMKKEHAELVEVERPAENGDVVLIDYTGYVDGETSESLQGTEHTLELGSGAFIPGFEEQLIGAEPNGDVELNLTFPEDYYEDMAGKDVTFQVHVHSVQEYQVADWGDAFIKETFGYDSEEAMKAAVRDELEQGAEAEADANLEYDLIQKLMESSEYDIQDTDTEAYIDEMMREYESYAAAYGVDLATFLQTYMQTTEETLRELFRQTAEFRVKMTISFHEIADREGISVTEEEYQQKLTELAEEYGYENAEAVEEAYSREMIEEQMIQEKAIRLIVENAVISE
ncbi:MAG: trigger factor [Clostridiales bacterium]|nr:trigger factor [Clostridiales bacterium]